MEARGSAGREIQDENELAETELPETDEDLDEQDEFAGRFIMPNFGLDGVNDVFYQTMLTEKLSDAPQTQNLVYRLDKYNLLFTIASL
ncbi:MAG: hypothetical protein M1836_005568 [Candelina mexicana]|nr:MAG: hypothetical protein M1836_005568 [Candelina mexicana]